MNRYIHGFGGDPDQATIQGTSAGSLSAHYLAHFPDRKFKRLILASGTTIGLGSKRMEEHQITFQKYVDALRASRAPTASDLELLQSVPAKDLVTAVETIIASPLVDGEWVQGDAATRLFPEAPPELMIGACIFEVSFKQIRTVRATLTWIVSICYRKA